MILRCSRPSAFVAVIAAVSAFLAVNPARLGAQGTGGSIAQSAQQAATALSADQQTAANSALCSALGSQVPNPATASPSLLSSPAVISAAATTFAGSTQLSVSSATSMLKDYVAQHATDIMTACASKAAGGLTSKIPGAGSIPSLP